MNHLQPFETHNADLGSLEACGDSLVAMAAEGLTNGRLAKRAYEPAVGYVRGVCSPQVEGADRAVQQGSENVRAGRRGRVTERTAARLRLGATIRSGVPLPATTPRAGRADSRSATSTTTDRVSNHLPRGPPAPAHRGRPSRRRSSAGADDDNSGALASPHPAQATHSDANTNHRKGNMKLLTRTAAVSAAATALVLTATPYASAGSDFHVYTDAESSRQCSVVNEAGSAKFESYGEIVTLYDHRSDGYGIGAHVFVNGNYKTTVSTAGSNTHNLSIAEGARVTIGVYVKANGQTCGYDEESGIA